MGTSDFEIKFDLAWSVSRQIDIQYNDKKWKWRIPKVEAEVDYSLSKSTFPFYRMVIILEYKIIIFLMVWLFGQI